MTCPSESGKDLSSPATAYIWYSLTNDQTPKPRVGRSARRGATRWLNAHRLKSNKKFYDGLRKRYTVDIEPAPQSPAMRKSRW